MNKTVLVLANNSGGLFRFRKELLSELIQLNHKVIVSTPFDDHVSELLDMGIVLVETKINRRGMNPITDLNLILQYKKLIKMWKPDNIITYTIKPNLYGGLVASRYNIPFSINITGLGSVFQQDNIIRKMVICWYKKICKNASTVFFENSGNKNDFLKYKITYDSKCIVLHGAGVNLEDFYFSKYPVNSKETIFLFIGRIMKEKGIEELLWAIEKLNRDQINVCLEILGSCEENYLETIKNYEEKGFVKYYGIQKDVRPYIEKSHCLVLPSYHEGMANVLLEAASMGRPLITSNICGCKEAVNLGKNGLLVEVKNRNDLYKKMREFIKLSNDEKIKMSFESRKHMETYFDKKKVVKETILNLHLNS